MSPGYYNVTATYTVSSSNTVNWDMDRAVGESPRPKKREMGTMDVLYCSESCHDFTEHTTFRQGRVCCNACNKMRRCSLCQAIEVEGHKCPEESSEGVLRAHLWCSYCEAVREHRPKERESRWRCSYCGSNVSCAACGLYWTKGHNCGQDSSSPSESIADSIGGEEMPVTIGSGIEMTLMVMPRWRTRVMALGPRLYAGPTYRAAVERAVLAMDRALRNGDQDLALDLLTQAEALAEAG